MSESDSKQLRKPLHTALRTWSSLNPVDFEPLDQYMVFRQSGEGLPWLDPLEKRRKINAFLERCIAELKKSKPQHAYLLRARFIEGQTILFLAHKLNLSQDQVNRRQREAIESLALTIEVMEEAARNERIWRLRTALPFSADLRVFGRGSTRAQLVAALGPSGPPFIAALTGLGGVGKTVLAQLAVHQVAETLAFQEIEWVALEAKRAIGVPPSVLASQIRDVLAQPLDSQSKDSWDLSRSLETTLKAEPRLIVMDGFDHAQSADLLRTIHRWANPSKFLLTSRAQLRDSPGLLQLPLAELDEGQATDFLHYCIQGRSSSHVVAQLESIVSQIYALIGGIPHALKLMAEKLRVWPLEVALQAFAEGLDPDIEGMYRAIYQPALRVLAPEARQVLAQLPDEAAQGISYAQLREISGIETISLRGVISELARHSLLEVRGSVEAPQYVANRLTLTFMKTGLSARY